VSTARCGIRLLWLLAALSLTAIAGASTSAPTHVAGLSLMMTSGEVVRTLRAQRVPVKALITSACVSDDLAMHRSEVPMSDDRGHCVEGLHAAYAGGSLLLSFTEDVPRRPGVSVLTTIALADPRDDAAVQRVIAAAGPPSLTDGKRPWTIAMWCFGFTCTDMNETLADPHAGPWLLIHRGAGLTLADDGAANRRERAADRVLASHGVRRVP
jgi:hypothetical protein